MHVASFYFEYAHRKCVRYEKTEVDFIAQPVISSI